MNLQEDIKPISYIKSNAAKILATINKTRRPIVITQNGEAKGVFIDPDSYQKMNNTLGLLKLLLQSEKDINKKKLKTSTEVFENIEKKINA